MVVKTNGTNIFHLVNSNNNNKQFQIRYSVCGMQFAARYHAVHCTALFVCIIIQERNLKFLGTAKKIVKTCFFILEVQHDNKLV